jgi:sugar lactone lactonase YvrE
MMKRPLTILLALLATPSLFAEGVIAPVSGVNGEPGHQDGTGGGARFNDPMGLARDTQGNLYICDARNHVIRKVAPGGVVSTLAGKPGEAGAVNGIGEAARFNFPADIAVSPTGILYVADSGNHCIRVIAANGAVTTLAGDLGSADDINVDYGEVFTTLAPQLDGTGVTARFNTPGGIAYSTSGFLYVSDTGNQLIRKVVLNGTVTTLAGKAGAWGTDDGTGAAARFNSPRGLCIGTDGNLYIADSLNHTIRCMTPAGVVTTFAGSTSEHGCKAGSRLQARFCEPTDITTHPGGGFIICESFGNALFRLKADGMVSILAGGAAPTTPSANKLSNPNSAVCDAQGNVYVSDTFNQEVRLIIEKFETSITRVNGTTQLTITWDSLSGRDYQLQILGEQGWGNTAHAPVRATGAAASITFPMTQDKVGIYRILLLGF